MPAHARVQQGLHEAAVAHAPLHLQQAHQAMNDPTMALMYAMDDPVYAASQVRLGNHDGELPDFWLVLPAGVQALLPQYMDVKSLCRTDSIMTNVLAREAWNIALRGT